MDNIESKGSNGFPNSISIELFELGVILLTTFGSPIRGAAEMKKIGFKTYPLAVPVYIFVTQNNLIFNSD